MPSSAAPRTWRCTVQDTRYIVSTDTRPLSRDFISKAFSSSEMYWAKELAAEELDLTLNNSLTLGLYVDRSPMTEEGGFAPAKTVSEPSTPRTPSPTLGQDSLTRSDAAPDADLQEDEVSHLEQVGMARFITDHVTLYYLTDVYVLPTCRGTGLGKWLIACCQDIMKCSPRMRRALLMASPDEGVKFYQKELGMYEISDEKEHVICMTRRRYNDEER